MKRRTFIASLAALNGVRMPLLAAKEAAALSGICTFSCNVQWQAVRNKLAGAAFSNASSFYGYVRTLGADGLQTSYRELDSPSRKALRTQCDKDHTYLEGDIRLPKSEADLEEFEGEVRATRETGAGVARTVIMGGRRYETFQTRDEFHDFHRQAKQRLELVEPILRKHRLKLAVENHKDLTVDEQVALLEHLSSEWIGALVDTGNNIALLDEPYRVVELLAPYAMSVHLKDMAVQPDANGFLLSEVPCGTGFLDLPRMIACLRRANPAIVFNLEMATRDPLRIPCLTDGYWTTFPERQATHLDAALGWVTQNPLKQPPPSVSGKPISQQIAEEETNNRASLVWMHRWIV